MSVETMIVGVVIGILSSLIGTLAHRKIAPWLLSGRCLSMLNCKHAAYLASGVAIAIACYHQQSIAGQMVSLQSLLGLAAFALADLWVSSSAFETMIEELPSSPGGA